MDWFSCAWFHFNRQSYLSESSGMKVAFADFILQSDRVGIRHIG